MLKLDLVIMKAACVLGGLVRDMYARRWEVIPKRFRETVEELRDLVAVMNVPFRSPLRELAAGSIIA